MRSLRGLLTRSGELKLTKSELYGAVILGAAIVGLLVLRWLPR